METKQFINDLSSGEEDRKKYVDRHEKFIDKIEEVEKVVEGIEINNVEEYKKGMAVKSFTTSLYCYAFNNDKDEFDRVAEIDSDLADKLYKFAKDHRKIKDSETRAVAKYFITCWQKYFRYEDKEKLVNRLIEEDKIRKKEVNGKERFYVIGLHYKVGDNTFTVGSNGEEYRNYKKSCVVQTFSIRGRYGKYIRENIDTSRIKELEDYYRTTTVRNDSKNCAKVYLSRKDKRIIRKEFCTR